MVEAALDYPEASRILASKLVGKQIERNGQRVRVTSAAVSAGGNGRMVLAVGFAGAADGTARLIGRPQFDSTSGELRVPDIDFDLASDNVVVRGFDWLKHDDVRDTLRTLARWPAAGLVDAARGSWRRRSTATSPRACGSPPRCHTRACSTCARPARRSCSGRRPPAAPRCS